MKIDWRSSHTQVLLNPRLPEEEARRLRRIVEKLPHFEGHVWVTTSGSTGTAGRFKWVALSIRAVLSSAEAVNAHLESDAKDIWIHALPSFHVGGLGIWARAFLSGARVVDFSSEQGKWDARSFVQSTEVSRATLSALVPTQVYDLVREKLCAPKSMRAIVIGGGELSSDLYTEARALGWPLLPSYGLTECGSQVATASIASLTRPEFPRLELLKHIEARINSEGFLEIRSPALLTGYGIETDSGIEFVDPKREGWLTTEDLGEIEGRAFVPRGRKGSFVKISGESVDFSRLEILLEELRQKTGARADAAIFLMPDERMGHRVHLAWSGSQDLGDWVAQLRARFDSQVLPIERIVSTRHVSQIPRSPLGKLLKSELLRAASSAGGVIFPSS